MFVIVQNNQKIDRLTAPIVAICREMGVPFYDLSYNEQLADALADVETDDPNVFIMGSTGFCRVARQTKFAPFIYWGPEAFVASQWKSYFGDDYIGASGEVIQGKDVPAFLPSIVRPERVEKRFNGGFYTVENWDTTIDIECFIMPRFVIENEYRFFIFNRKIVSGTIYRKSTGQHIEMASDTAVFVFVEKQLSKIPLDNITLDVAQIGDTFKVLELNCLNTSGWYHINCIRSLLTTIKSCDIHL